MRDWPGFIHLSKLSHPFMGGAIVDREAIMLPIDFITRVEEARLVLRDKSVIKLIDGECVKILHVIQERCFVASL